MNHHTPKHPTADIPHDNRLGRCYDLAGKTILHAEDTVLVHGSIKACHYPDLGHEYVELPDEAAPGLGTNTDTKFDSFFIGGYSYPRLAHAWVELQDGTIWEPGTNVVWKPEIFDKIFNPKVDVKYPNQAALELILKYGTYGPWS